MWDERCVKCVWDERRMKCMWDEMHVKCMGMVCCGMHGKVCCLVRPLRGRTHGRSALARFAHVKSAALVWDLFGMSHRSHGITAAQKSAMGCLALG